MKMRNFFAVMFLGLSSLSVFVVYGSFVRVCNHTDRPIMSLIGHGIWPGYKEETSKIIDVGDSWKVDIDLDCLYRVKVWFADGTQKTIADLQHAGLCKQKIQVIVEENSVTYGEGDCQ